MLEKERVLREEATESRRRQWWGGRQGKRQSQSHSTSYLCAATAVGSPASPSE